VKRSNTPPGLTLVTSIQGGGGGGGISCVETKRTRISSSGRKIRGANHERDLRRLTTVNPNMLPSANEAHMKT